MSELKQQMREDRTIRDAARGLVEADIANLRADLTSKSLGERALGRVGESASQLLDHVSETAQNNRGILATLLGAIALWFARNPIKSLFGDSEDSGSGSGAKDGE